MVGKWSDELVRVLNNWAMWVACDGNPGGSHSSIYDNGPSGPRAGNVIPVLSGEAMDVDQVICRLPVRYQKPLKMHYCWPGRSDRSKAATCNCCLNTYKTRLDDAHVLFSRSWYGRKQTIAPKAA